MKNGAADRSLHVVDARGGYINSAAAISREIIGSNERPTSAVLVDGADLFAGVIELNDGVRVVARDQQMIAPIRDESGSAAMLATPIDRCTLAIPHLYSRSGVFDKQQLAVV